MKSEFVASRQFVRGVTSRKDRVFIISKGKALLDQGVAHTSVIGVESGKWTDCVNTVWDANAIAVARAPSPKLIVVGEDGDVIAFMGGTNSAKEKLPIEPSAIRNARTISGFVFACGMKRQVFKRVDEARWVDVSAPAPAAMGYEATGFESIDGYSGDEVYAVGWKGELWHYDGSTWHDHSLATNLVLNAVCCAPDGNVYVAGQQGVLARGRSDAWEMIDLDGGFERDIWDLCWFQDKLYVSTMTTLFTLTGNRLEEVNFGEMGRPSCNSLTAVDGVLWSIGRDEVASFDGQHWTLYT